MPAAQQSQNPIYKETSNIPRSDVSYYTRDARDTPGAALSKLLGVTSGIVADQLDTETPKQDAHDDDINLAHAQLGLEKFNSAQSKGAFSFLEGDFDKDSYAAKQGQLDASEYAGQLRDKFMADGVFDSADPEAFNIWLKENASESIAAAKAKGPSFYGAFVGELGNNVELMGKQFAGHSQNVVQRRSQDAFKNKLKMSDAANKYATNQSDLNTWMEGFLDSESKGNWNIWNHASSNSGPVTELTIGELLKKQAAPGDDAAGLIQIVPGTLKTLVSQYGYSKDTKMTPQVQMEMGLLLMKKRGMDKWLRGEMSDGAFVDHLAKEWAGLKQSNGKGYYDKMKNNNASESHDATVKRIGELRYLMDKNPQLKKWISAKDPKAGGGAALLTGKSKTAQDKLLTDEVASGLSNKKMRDIYADNLSEELGAGQGDLDEDAVEAEIKGARLNSDQADRVREAAATGRTQAKAAETRELAQRVQSADTFLRSGDEGDLGDLKETSPRTYRRLMDIQAGATEYDPTDIATTTSEFEERVTYGSAGFPQEALGALLKGEITQETYTASMDQHTAQVDASPVLQVPSVQKMLKAFTVTMLPEAQELFLPQLSLMIADLRASKEGTKPTVSEVMEAAGQLRDQLNATFVADSSSVLSNPAYN